MNLLLVTAHIVPYPGREGTSVVTWSMLNAFRDLGHQISVCILRHPKGHADSPILEPLRKAQIPVYVLDASPDSCDGTAPSPIAASYPDVAFSTRLKSIVQQVQPDCLLLYSVQAVAAARGAGMPFRAAITVDLDHVNRRERLYLQIRYHQSRRRFLSVFREFARISVMRRHQLELLKGCDLVFNHAAHHSSWLRTHGVTQTIYLPNPVNNPGNTYALERSRDYRGSIKRIRIIVVGSTKVLATLAGYELLADDYIPALDRNFAAGEIEVHLIGSNEGLPRVIDDKLRRSQNVIFRGYVRDLAEEYRRSDIVLVPTPLIVGARVRIAEALSFGCCVVAHSNNRLGMPDLIEDQNILFADTGKDLVSACRRLRDDGDLRRRLSVAARDSFERCYDAPRVCESMARIIERVRDGSNRVEAGTDENILNLRGRAV